MVRELVVRGMDCVRINSYDGRPACVAMGEHLKRAKRFIDARGSSRRMVVTGASDERVEDPLRDEPPFRLEMARTGSLAGPVAAMRLSMLAQIDLAGLKLRVGLENGPEVIKVRWRLASDRTNHPLAKSTRFWPQISNLIDSALQIANLNKYGSELAITKAASQRSERSAPRPGSYR